MVPEQLEPRLELLREEYVLVQAWKKTASYIRYHNWFSDTLAHDRAAVNLPAFLGELGERLQSSESWRNDPLRIVPAPKSQRWRVREGVWEPVKGARSARLRWILSNYARARRENRMYVDYVQDITVEDGEYDWVSPLPDSLYREYGDATPRCLVVARALHRVGMTTPEGLAAVADLWRGFRPQPQTTRQELLGRNFDSLVRVSEARQNREVDPKDARSVCHHWPFPLWPLDLRQSKGPTEAELRLQRAEQIKARLKRESERDPAPLVTREKVEELTKAHSDFKLEWERLIASLPENRNSGLQIVKGSVRSYRLESYERLRRMVGNLEVEELMDLAALGWFGRQPESGWAHCHQNARRIISDASIGYVCGLGQHWMTGLERWEGPPQLPARLTIGGDTA